MQTVYQKHKLFHNLSMETIEGTRYISSIHGRNEYLGKVEFVKDDMSCKWITDTVYIELTFL